MILEDAIKARYSVRRFAATNVAAEVVERLVELATWAPSAGNLQPWRFVAVRDPARKAALAEAAWGQRFVAQAPVVVVICADPERSAARYGDRGRTLYCLQDTAAATQTFLLAAAAQGIGSCWVGAFDEEEVRRVLGLTEGLRPVAIVPLGYAADKQRETGAANMARVAGVGPVRKRRPLAEVYEVLE